MPGRPGRPRPRGRSAASPRSVRGSRRPPTPHGGPGPFGCRPAAVRRSPPAPPDARPRAATRLIAMIPVPGSRRPREPRRGQRRRRVEEQPVAREQRGSHALLGDLGPPRPAPRPARTRGLEARPRTRRREEEAQGRRASGRGRRGASSGAPGAARRGEETSSATSWSPRRCRRTPGWPPPDAQPPARPCSACSCRRA